MWSRNVLEENQTPNLIFGMSASPLVDGDRVVVAPGGVENAVISFDRNNGSRIWASGSESGSYSSPQIESICGVKSVLSFNGDGLSGFRFSDGKPMFHVPWLANPAEKNNVCQPIVVETNVKRSRIFVSSGYGKGSAVFEIRKTGQAFEVS